MHALHLKPKKATMRRDLNMRSPPQTQFVHECCVLVWGFLEGYCRDTTSEHAEAAKSHPSMPLGTFTFKLSRISEPGNVH